MSLFATTAAVTLHSCPRRLRRAAASGGTRRHDDTTTTTLRKQRPRRHTGACPLVPPATLVINGSPRRRRRRTAADVGRSEDPADHKPPNRNRTVCDRAVPHSCTARSAAPPADTVRRVTHKVFVVSSCRRLSLSGRRPRPRRRRRGQDTVGEGSIDKQAGLGDRGCKRFGDDAARDGDECAAGLRGQYARQRRPRSMVPRMVTLKPIRPRSAR